MTAALAPTTLPQNTAFAFGDLPTADAIAVADDRRRQAITLQGRVLAPVGRAGTCPTPNSMLRCALFTCSSRPEYVEERAVASVGSSTITFTGGTLIQADLDVWMACLQLADGQLGSEVNVSAYDLLKHLGRTPGENAYRSLHRSLVRLNAGHFRIEARNADGTVNRPFAGSLLRYESNTSVKSKGDRRLITFSVNKQLAELFGPGLWTMVNLEQRNALAGSSIAQWTHGLLSTHAEPFPYRAETLLTLSGSSLNLAQFKYKLKEALGQLVDIGFLKSFEISKDKGSLVTVVRA